MSHFVRYSMLAAGLVLSLVAASTTPNNTRVFAPITLSCTTTPALSGTYLVDENMMTTLNVIIGDFVVSGNKFPAIASQVSVIDTAGAVHTFPNQNAFQQFYAIVAVYWMQIADYQNRTNAGQSPTLPASTSSAC